MTIFSPDKEPINKKNLMNWILGFGVGVFTVLVQGVAVDQMISDKIGHALKTGDWSNFFGYAVIFILIWLPVRGLKKEVAKLNDTIASSFARGETRFTKLESRQLDFEHRLTQFESAKITQ